MSSPAETKVKIVKPFQVSFIGDAEYETIITNNEKAMISESNQHAMLVSHLEREKVLKSSINIDNLPLDKVNDHAISTHRSERKLIKKNNTHLYEDIPLGTSKCDAYIKLSSTVPSGNFVMGGRSGRSWSMDSRSENITSSDERQERGLLCDYKSDYDMSEYNCVEYRSTYEGSDYKIPDYGGV
jgi:hypothetical protein